ncbi:aldehyde dehydrogenase family protein [Streptomyces sp. DW26H14]|uniref:aldehyde dehydrogenase family protein n=1 Tax=Streptomyces sp. DW26H14 TaxID=3435395 RepID=UPI00403D7CF6
MTARTAGPPDVSSYDPRTGAPVATVPSTTLDEVRDTVARAAAAAERLTAMGREGRARMLRAMADALDHDGERIVATADRETAISTRRLTGELTRTTYQLRLFADALDEGSYLEAAVDHAGPTPMGPGPDLRRMLVPIGPVAVFGASNFPLAFSVPGGDTAAALAAGCPVVVKAHDSHLATCALALAALRAGAEAAGAPDGTVGMVCGLQAGRDLVAAPPVRAVTFTGSLSGAQALRDIIAERPDPIPFYGELSSVNPVVVTGAAAKARGSEIAEGLVGSFTTAAGQLCTKPGLALVPRTPAGDALVDRMAELVAATGPQTLLNERISGAYRDLGRTALSSGATLLATGHDEGDAGFHAAASLTVADAAAPATDLTRERFGPAMVVVRYSGDDELLEALSGLTGSLTATLHLEDGEDRSALVRRLTGICGRVVFNGYPTGVLVSWAQHHGGPWPATNTVHTSVGVTSVRRFLRPVVWQDAPRDMLPDELRDGPVDVPRRVDGSLILPGGHA